MSGVMKDLGGIPQPDFSEFRRVAITELQPELRAKAFAEALEGVTDPVLKEALPLFATLLFPTLDEWTESKKGPSSIKVFRRRQKTKLERALADKDFWGDSKDQTAGQLYDKVREYMTFCLQEHGDLTSGEQEKVAGALKLLVGKENNNIAFYAELSREGKTTRRFGLFNNPERRNEILTAIGNAQLRQESLPLLADNVAVLVQVRKAYDAALGELLEQASQVELHAETIKTPEDLKSW